VRQLLLLDWVLITALGWLAIGLVGVSFPRRLTLISRVLFPLGAIFGLVLALLALSGMVAGTQVRILPLGLPTTPGKVISPCASCCCLTGY